MLNHVVRNKALQRVGLRAATEPASGSNVPTIELLLLAPTIGLLLLVPTFEPLAQVPAYDAPSKLWSKAKSASLISKIS